ncbi:alpha/beta fold hydrolase [Limnoraphis robusta CCNP1324]|uniref:alpha/beta hydrolase n=1 Tax=Limnoraphis robusta TaxID=1118279 RepID=UPI002B1EAEC5|nr:alpha/beta fold hydrolase [Limnoraphis robusta]MEA5549339.1 alpha/beta fold hydrolase [Limnoraphis robusta CCNP1324]
MANDVIDPRGGMAAEEVTAEIANGLSLRGLYHRAISPDRKAPVCVCIHGLGVDLNVWQFVAPEIQARGVSALCLDLRGHGLSDRGNRRNLTPKRMARDILDACRRLELNPSFLLAQSFGTCVGLELLDLVSEEADAPTLFAVTPVWLSSRRSFRSLPSNAVTTARFLREIAGEAGLVSTSKPSRRDHTRFAGLGDSYLPRFAAEAASISWMSYARMLVWLRLQGYLHTYDWGRLSAYPVRMIAASD